jgi:uncharacterized damage-inducible protein DinB
MIKRPKKDEYPPFCEIYMSCVPARGTAKSLLKQSFKTAQQVLGKLTPEQADYAYAEGKWTIKQLVQHLIDTERVFAYRILSFMRGDRAPLPGFNQDHWMELVDVSNRTLPDLLKEWKAVRDNTLFLLDQCTEEQSRFQGIASNWKVTPRAYFFIITGHQLHHFQVLQRHYLNAGV